MLTQRQGMHTNAAVAVASVALVLLAAGRSAALVETESLPSPTSPEPPLETRALNASREEPRVLLVHKPCREEHSTYCGNGGQCMYPQDTQAPFCRCKAMYMGPRCMFIIGSLQSGIDYEQIIGITAGVAALVLVLASAIYCVYRRCSRSGLLISHGSKDSV